MFAEERSGDRAPIHLTRGGELRLFILLVLLLFCPRVEFRDVS
jgi:hypothetical protein